MMRLKRILIILCLNLLLTVSLLLTGCAKNSDSIRSISDLKDPGRTIAVAVGAPEELLVREDFSEAEILPYSDMVAAYTSVQNGKIDACIRSRNELTTAIRNGISGVHLLDETYCVNTVAVGISRVSSIPDLKEKQLPHVQSACRKRV